MYNNIKDMYNGECAKLLANLRAIAVRQGAFCAHPYVKRLLNLDTEEYEKYLTGRSCKIPGMIRVSFGAYNSLKELDIFLKYIYDI